MHWLCLRHCLTMRELSLFTGSSMTYVEKMRLKAAVQSMRGNQTSLIVVLYQCTGIKALSLRR